MKPYSQGERANRTGELHRSSGRESFATRNKTCQRPDSARWEVEELDTDIYRGPSLDGNRCDPRMLPHCPRESKSGIPAAVFVSDPKLWETEAHGYGNEQRPSIDDKEGGATHTKPGRARSQCTRPP